MHIERIDLLKLGAILTVVLTASFLLRSIVAIAAPPGSKYTAGETLDPSCSPGDANCTVEIASGSEFTDAGSFVYPSEGDYVSAPYLSATSTTATSTFWNAVLIGTTTPATSDIFEVHQTGVGSISIGTVLGGVTPAFKATATNGDSSIIPFNY